jgi:murein DD-endopeptidase MepM/ murein hydrolase activator NlpD
MKMLLKKSKHRKFFQILIIPDDQAEPRTFSVAVRKMRLYKILAVVLALHLIVGLISYYFLFHTMSRNKELVTLNQQLNRDNRKVYQLLEQAEALEIDQAKIRAALGLENQLDVEGSARDNVTMYRNLVSRSTPSPVQVEQEGVDFKDKLGFLQRSKSTMHDYVASVPTYLPVEGVLTNDFKSIYSFEKASHRGIDIAAPSGSFVRASADGVVVFAGWTYDLGNLLVLYHGNGFFTYYGHNQRLLLQRSDIAKKGEPIALLGNTGISSAPHLHFEMWKDGEPLDPKEYILAFSKIKS